jgi:hypothetical protein
MQNPIPSGLKSGRSVAGSVASARPPERQPKQMVRLLGVLGLAALMAAVQGVEPKMPVQLCACDSSEAASQQWLWEPRSAGHGGHVFNAASELRLKARPDLCLYKGWPKGSYLYVDECSAGKPLQVSLHSEHNRALVRDLSVLTDGTECMDADGMSKNLQFYNCIADDDDQQYAAIDGYNLIVDLWTGFANCMGVVNATRPGSCPPPAGVGAGPSPAPPPPQGVASTAMSPRYHLNDGPYRQSDPSGCIEINGTWFVFPDGSGGPQGGSVYTSPDLVHWTRRPTNIRFGETGGIGVTDAGVAVTFGGGYHFTDLKSDPYMSHWSGADLGQGDPHSAHGMGPKNVFRNGDPARPFKFKGEWFIVLGAGKNASTAAAPAIPDCPLCNNPWMQGELRLYKATNSTLTDWNFVNAIYATNQTAGRTLLNDNTWASEMRDCPTCPMHSISNMFECP